VRSAGTGGYLSAQALSFANRRIEARTKVENLPADADPVAALDKTRRSDKVMKKGEYHHPSSGSRGA
jgi:Periplasmic lysozyme inhibitor of I-type lysozyme